MCEELMICHRGAEAAIIASDHIDGAAVCDYPDCDCGHDQCFAAPE
jgi:hypothetical protein